PRDLLPRLHGLLRSVLWLLGVGLLLPRRQLADLCDRAERIREPAVGVRRRMLGRSRVGLRGDSGEPEGRGGASAGSACGTAHGQGEGRLAEGEATLGAEGGWNEQVASLSECHGTRRGPRRPSACFCDSPSRAA